MASNDLCTPEGARRLKERIEAYWKESADTMCPLIWWMPASCLPCARPAPMCVPIWSTGMPRPANDRGEQRRSA